MKRVLLYVLLSTLTSPAPAEAGELDAMVTGWYRVYQADKGGPSALSLVRPHASKRLAALIAKEERCKAKTGELCNLEFDVIVNGQDWLLKGLHVEAAKLDGAQARVTARFTNVDTPQEIVYSFVRDAGTWKLDDIESRSPKAERWALSRILAR
jgi:hypothetical protein